MSTTNLDRLIKARRIKNLKKELAAAALSQNLGRLNLAPVLDTQTIFCGCGTQMMKAEAIWAGANELLCKICA